MEESTSFQFEEFFLSRVGRDIIDFYRAKLELNYGPLIVKKNTSTSHKLLYTHTYTSKEYSIHIYKINSFSMICIYIFYELELINFLYNYKIR